MLDPPCRRRGDACRRGGVPLAHPLLSRFGTLAPDAVVGTVWLNGAPAGRIDLAGELDTAISLVVADGRITRIYAIRNPHKLARLDEEATLSR